MIDDYPCDNILNGKGEWGANLVPRPRFEDGNMAATPGNNARLNRNQHGNRMLEYDKEDRSKKRKLSDRNQPNSEATDSLATRYEEQPCNNILEQDFLSWQQRHEQSSSVRTSKMLKNSSVCAIKPGPIKNMIEKVMDILLKQT